MLWYLIGPSRSGPSSGVSSFIALRILSGSVMAKVYSGYQIVMCNVIFFLMSHIFKCLSVFRLVQYGQLATFKAVQKLAKIGCVSMLVCITEDWTALAKKNAVYIYTCVCVCVCMCVYIIL